jgi:sulfate transport system permease protein
MPLRVEKLFQDYDNPASFAVASLLTLLALVTLALKVAAARKTRRELEAATRIAPADGEA